MESPPPKRMRTFQAYFCTNQMKRMKNLIFIEDIKKEDPNIAITASFKNSKKLHLVSF